MRNVPSQWSTVALWADVRVIAGVCLFCALMLGVFAAGTAAAYAAVSGTAGLIARAVRAVWR